MTTAHSIRLFLSDALSSGSVIQLDDKRAHYVKDVMRCKLGDTLSLFNGTDGEWRACITDIKKKQLSLEVEHCVRPQAPEPDIWLIFAPLKHARIDYLAQKATELGVSSLLPVMTQHTMVSRVNTDRLRANAIEAAEQCERLSVPSVAEPQRLDQLLDGWADEKRSLIWCNESGGGVPIGQLDTGLSLPMALLIGPEGGFSVQEQERIRTHPAVKPVGLGPRVMRADTAAIAGLACLMSRFADWQDAPSFRAGVAEQGEE